jgi:phosphotriesterase-related protein
LPTVQTARGPIDPSQLGTTLMHEHVFILDTEIQHNYPHEWGSEEKRVADAVARLNELKSRGVDTIVDLTVIGIGRCIPRIVEIAKQTELQIIVATGIYTYRELPHYFYLRPPDKATGADPMTDMFLHDIREGIAGTGVKAGILKCCTDEPGLTPDIERILRAIARAHRQSGVPISTHTHAGLRRGLDQQRIFREEGVDLSRVVIGHSGDSTDLDYLEELMRSGSYLGMDRFGVDSILAFADRVNTVAQLCQRGHANQMVLSHDACCFFHWAPEGAAAAFLPNWHYLHIHNDVLPALRQKGVTEAQLHAMLVENPRKIFAHQIAY